MLREILSITGKPGLFKIVAHNGRVLLVEDIKTGKRFPISQRDKVVALGDVAMYTIGDDKPLADIFEACYKLNDGKTVNVKELQKEGKLSDLFAEVLPDYDRDRVYPNDIRKMFTWYNALVDSGFTSFVNEAEEAADTEDNKTE